MTETWIGKPIRRVDGPAKVRGALKYAGDYYAPDMLHCRLVLAPHPHAVIDAIHTQAALAVPGVVRVLTAKDLPGEKYFNSLFEVMRPVLVVDKTRYIGDVIAVVVAASEQAASIGAAEVRIDFTPLTLVDDPEKVIRGEYAFDIHAGRSNILKEIHYSSGDVDAAFARPDVLTLEQTYHLQSMDHAFIETESGFAYPEDGGVRIISGSQSAFHNRAQVAKCLALPEEKVRMIEPQTGGAFGGKANVTVHILVGLAALLTGKPCRMVWTRKEHFISAIKRHPLKITLKTGVTRAGDLVAHQSRTVVDKGAYIEIGSVFLDTVVENLTGPYKIPNVKVDAWTVFTNNLCSGAIRGLGAGEGCLAIESQMSQMAQMIEMDPIEFRIRNLLHQGDTHGAGHQLLKPVGTHTALQTALKHPLWREHRSMKPALRGNIRRGVGVAIGMKGYSMGINDAWDYSTAIMELQPNGRIMVKLNVLECGQGALTVLSQIAAETLNCPIDMIDLHTADTTETLDAGMTAASRMTYVLGRGTQRAAQELARMILAVAAQEFDTPVENLQIVNGVVVDKNTTGRYPLSLVAEAASQPLKVVVNERIPLSEIPSKGPLAHPHVLYSSMVQIAEVEVDIETGQVALKQMICFADLGRAINPQGVEGQCEGGVALGMGYALMEKIHLSEGRVQNPDLSTYPIPTSWDVPHVETIMIEEPEDSGPFGAKGIGENATVPTAPAILNAIEDATGIRFTSLPVTPECIVQALALEDTVLR
jgi:CO/xanthine dehydrogenase Mo-binding subunit